MGGRHRAPVGAGCGHNSPDARPAPPRGAPARAVAACAALALIAPTAPAQAPGPAGSERARVLLAFLPAPAPAQPVAPADADPGPAFRWALDALAAQPRLSLGLSSAVQGTYDREQAFLDISQGTRVSLKSYDPTEPPPLLLRPAAAGTGRLAGWPAVRARAAEAPADVQPGLLAGTVPGGAGYAGDLRTSARRGDHRRRPCGAIAQLSLGGAADVVRRARGLLERRALVVAALPPGTAGRRRWTRSSPRTGPASCCIVMQAPPGGADAQLLPTGALGLGGTPGGRLTSQTTHTDGVVAGIDLAPTILEHLGIPIPGAVKGQPITSERGRDAAALNDLTERLRVVLPRRLPTLWTLLGSWVAVLLAAMLVADRRGARWAFRVGPLAVLWLPTVLLLTAALAPSRTGELLLATGLALVAGALTDRLVPVAAGPTRPGVRRARRLRDRPGLRLTADHPLAAGSQSAVRRPLLRDRERARSDALRAAADRRRHAARRPRALARRGGGVRGRRRRARTGRGRRSARGGRRRGHHHRRGSGRRRSAHAPGGIDAPVRRARDRRADRRPAAARGRRPRNRRRLALHARRSCGPTTPATSGTSSDGATSWPGGRRSAASPLR